MNNYTPEQFEAIIEINQISGIPLMHLDEQMEIGGNVSIATWVIDNDAGLDEVVAAALKVMDHCS
ncbi:MULTISPECIES: hypothetical protein [unclassified Methylobacter]|jgi:hypothetical protein|uniref:hypothetical protein n=1 Tax=unclassified Methylobacter TaxID=2635283 RepID=UPI001894E81B|nr:MULTISPECIES: hypothetical protein [unclassified Methylobacter]MBF6649125.1 hypothetical protein [Methylobacter sp. BlB1]WAK04285.1 hypothetical protein LZ558_21690 [Methylobacter sp. YRD-M1]